MKTPLRIIAICIALAFGPTLALTSCATPPDQRTATVHTLQTVGHAAEGAVEVSAILYKTGKINGDQAQAVITFYNSKFQPAFRLAVSAAKFDTTAIAPQDVLNLANQLQALVDSYRKP